MKKALIAAAVIFSTGILTVCVRREGIKPASTASFHLFSDFRKELATAD